MGSIEDYPEVGKVLYELHCARNVQYQDSWKKRGHLGVFFNLARKFDRIEVFSLLVRTKGEIEALKQIGPSLLDSLADLVNYGVLWLAYFREEEPELYTRWKMQQFKSLGKEQENE